MCPLCFHGGPDTRPWSPLCPRAESGPFHVLQSINNCYNLDQPQPQDEVVLSASELAFGSQFPNNVPIIGEMLHLDLTDSSARLPREPEFDFSRKGVDFPRENQLPQLKDESLSMILDKFRTLCIPDSCSPSPQTSQTPKIPLVLAGSSHTDNQLKSQGVFKRPINIGNARGSGKKRVKPNSDSSRSNPESQRKLACPFYARDPESHKHRTSCYKTGFPNTTRVKYVTSLTNMYHFTFLFITVYLTSLLVESIVSATIYYYLRTAGPIPRLRRKGQLQNVSSLPAPERVRL